MSSEEEYPYKSIPNIPSQEEAAEVNDPNYQPGRFSRIIRKITRPWVGGVAGLSAATIAGMANPTEIHAQQPANPNPSDQKPSSVFDGYKYQIGQPTLSPKEMTEKEDLNAPIIVDLANPKRDPSEVVHYNPSRALQVVLPEKYLSVPLEVDSSIGIHPVILMDLGDYYKGKMSPEEFARFIRNMRTDEYLNYTRSKIIVPNSEDPNWESHWTDDDPQFNIVLFSPKNPDISPLSIPIKINNNKSH